MNLRAAHCCFWAWDGSNHTMEPTWDPNEQGHAQCEQTSNPSGTPPG
eukprot:CAMPEP_0119138774 /NCGR_PEP_ID=MMETSP1310-20130426/26304_1 /TAXON_ID=464262 /ORGANISM="Genus nov. species nov., Strain RCC2339" /LENGTH=46 /DNA_ID= /DNA_START= /DNA_END= /DNA_ORIENTATION=